MKKPLVVYHGPTCLDGLFAAASMKLLLGDAEFVVGRYQSNDEVDFADRDVYVVDFSYSAERTLEIAKVAKSLTVLDHHKTAIENLLHTSAPNLCLIVDTTKSGAMLAWEYFVEKACLSDGEPPRIIQHVQDHDLWQFKFKDTKALITGLYAESLTIDQAEVLIINDVFDGILEDGRVLLEAKLKDCQKIIDSAARYINFGSDDISFSFLTVNAPFMLASDIGNILAEEHGVGVTYFDSKEHRSFSFRSDGSVDVSAICKKFGGGGHHNAAGFKVKRDHYLASI